MVRSGKAGGVRLVSVWCGSARQGRLGKDWQGLTGYGLARCGKAGLVWRGWARTVNDWIGKAGKERCCSARNGSERLGAHGFPDYVESLVVQGENKKGGKSWQQEKHLMEFYSAKNPCLQ